MKIVKFIAKLLIVIGALNWGLIGFFGYDLVGDIFGGMHSAGARIIYALVGLAGIWGISLLCNRCGCGCGSGGGCCKK